MLVKKRAGNKVKFKTPGSAVNQHFQGFITALFEASFINESRTLRLIVLGFQQIVQNVLEGVQKYLLFCLHQMLSNLVRSC